MEGHFIKTAEATKVQQSNSNLLQPSDEEQPATMVRSLADDLMDEANEDIEKSDQQDKS